MHDGDRRGDKGGWEGSGWGKDWRKWGGSGTRRDPWDKDWKSSRSDYGRYTDYAASPTPPGYIELRDVDNVRHAAETLRSRYRDFAESEVALTGKTMMKEVSIRFTEAQL